MNIPATNGTVMQKTFDNLLRFFSNCMYYTRKRHYRKLGTYRVLCTSDQNTSCICNL